MLAADAAAAAAELPCIKSISWPGCSSSWHGGKPVPLLSPVLSTKLLFCWALGVLLSALLLPA
jgi:hypothetical protein